jgi:[acyl-carrier-protein] S-malonyltransferase
MSVAAVFPGQGSQSIGMLSALAAAEPAVRATFATASTVLGYDLWELTQNGPLEDLNLTERTQPAMLAAGVAVYRAWQAHDVPRPTVLAGHSLGEFTALVCAGAMDFADAVALVQFRGRVMQEAMPTGQGAMAAILGLDDAEVEGACADSALGEVVEPVNYNSPGQLVIAGHAQAVHRAIEACKARGAKRALLLPVSVPAHSSLLRPAAERLGERLETMAIRVPDVPVCAMGRQWHDSPSAIRALLVAQLASAVRWSDTVARIIGDGATHVVECGPGKVLTALNRRIERNKEISMTCIEDPASLASARHVGAGI